MYAVVKTGGKQYKVSEGTQFKVEKLDGEPGVEIVLNEVLLIGGKGSPRVGTPVVDGAAVRAQIVEQARDKKILVYKKKRRKGYEKKYGHRQHYTELKVTKIEA